MIFIFGPLWSGKRTVAKKLLGCDDAELTRRAMWDVQELAQNRSDLSELLVELSHFDAVIATEIGGGIVPIDPVEREVRERAGRLNCLLAERADTVVRVFCGIPKAIKGELP